MIRSYFKAAWRNLTNNRLFSVLNIFGLAIGLCVALLLSLFIIQERSFDLIPGRDRVFRYVAHVEYDGTSELWAGVPNAIGPTVKNNIPEVELSARTLLDGFGDNATITVGNNAFIEQHLYWADPDIVEIFDLRLLYGDRETALSGPNTILLSETKARQYFGDENPIDKAIELDRNTTLTVKGVYADLPATSTFDAELIGSFSTTNFSEKLTWDNASFETWIMLRGAGDRYKVETYLPKMMEDHVGKEGTYYTLSLQPLNEVHLNSAEIKAYSPRQGDASQLWQLTCLAAALLLMAAINYMNLATARAQHRNREVGISKTLGASRQGLVAKFYTETALLALIAIAFGLALAVPGIPIFNALSGKTLEYATLFHPVFWMGLPLLWLLLTLVSGLYPAIVLSSCTPLDAFRKGKAIRVGAVLFRRALVVLQFSVSIVLIVGVVIMYRQMDFVSQRKLGYNPENVIAISLGSLKGDQELDALRNQIENLAATQSIVVSQAFPGKGESGHRLHKGDSDKQGMMFYANRVNGDIEDVLKLKLLAGRMVKERVVSDTTEEGNWIFEMVLNKHAVDYLGLTPEEAIGRKPLAGIGDNTYIVGVVDDFNYASLHEPIGAYAFTNTPAVLRYLLVRFTTGDLRATLRQYEQAFRQVVPDAPFDYTFLDSHLESLYLADQQTAAVLLAFSVLAVLVGCLGLFGLAAFTAEKRTREIGVRKVLGASVPGIIALLSGDFVKLVLIAILIASPIAWWAVSKWLENFAYRIDIEWWVFALTGLLAIVVALLTVGFQAAKAALTNPVRSLRSE